MSRSRKPTVAGRRLGHRTLRRLGSVVASALLLTGVVGPTTPTTLGGAPGAQEQADDGARVYPNGRVVEANPAPITTPVSGADNPGTDPSVGGPPLFVPYTPPADTAELPDERTARSRTLAKPDGTFTTEVSNGPINFQDAAGAWQPIDLSLVPDDGGYKVAASAGTVRLDTKDGAIGSIENGGHRVSLSAPGYSTGTLGSQLDVNRLTFKDALGTAADVWARPIDIGLEFGASWPDASVSTPVSFVLDAGDLTASLSKDERSIVFTDVEGKFAGRIDQPIVREGSEDGPPLLDVVSVSLVALSDGTQLLTYELDPSWFAAPERIFPIILDPTWCIGEGAAGCDDNTTSPNSLDTFVYDADPSGYEIGWTVLRTGYDVRSDDGGTYGKMRSILFFPQVALPDGAVIYDTDLQARVCCLYGNAQGQTITAYRLTKLVEMLVGMDVADAAFDKIQGNPNATAQTDAALLAIRGYYGFDPLDGGEAGGVGLAVAGGGMVRGGVYSLRDPGGNVLRTGRSNDLGTRRNQLARDPIFGEYEFHPEYLTDDYNEQRGLEQHLYDLHPEALAKNGGLNRIRGIRFNNPRISSYLSAARGFLDRNK